MNQFLKVLLFSVFIGATKAHHFVKVVILAGLGLAGLWMVHTLAQDWNKIHEGEGGGKLFGGGKFFAGLGGHLEKRSLDNHPQRPEINWEFVLSRDPAKCARSFVCQLAAQEESLLDETERSILDLTRYSAQKDTWPSKQLQEALKHGEKLQKPLQCMKIYKLCPYTSQMMLRLLRLFGG